MNNSKNLKYFRIHLRQNLTPAEATLWTFLRNKKVKGRKFRRQHSVGGYILDFYCPEEKLAIELDGEIQNSIQASEYDFERDYFLDNHGIKVLRFENKMVFESILNVQSEIERHFNWYK